MLGLGKWKFHVNTRFYSGDAFLFIGGKDGEYDIRAELASGKKPDFRFSKVKEEGSAITGVAQHSLLQGSLIPFSVTFEGGSASGFLDVPFVGMIKLIDGEKVG
ncbi:MAG: hypothetical protein LBB75_07730 [Oscillospiraceae bacterium]|jgi:hypothetical protein|nr:hypothetical protein [Oscillospiraceae bacterium]